MKKRAAIATSMPALAALLTGLVGCGGDKKAAAPPASAAAAQDKAAATAPADAAASAGEAKGEPGGKVKVVEGAAPGGDDRYTVAVEPGSATVGQESKVVVRVVPKEPWHINLDFPTSLELQPPPSVQMAKTALKKSDAAALDDNEAVFDVKFTPTSAGEQSFTGTFKFAVCQDDACAPVTENVQFQVAVK